MCSSLRNRVLQDKREKGGWAGRGRDQAEAEERRERERNVGQFVIEEGVGCSSTADKCDTLRQGLSRSKLDHSQIWGAGVLNHPALGARVDR